MYLFPAFNDPIYAKYLPTSVLCFWLLFFRLWSPLLRLNCFKTLSPVAFQAYLPPHALQRTHIRAVILRCAKASQPDSITLFAISSALFCTRFKALLLCMGSKTPLHTQVWVSLLPYKLNVFYCHFSFWVHSI
jgi:hypothetical protein